MFSKVAVAALAGILLTAATGIGIAVTGPGEAKTEPETAKPANINIPVQPVFNLTWTGHYKLGLADCIMLVVTGFCPAHTYETEPLVEPVAKAGVRVDIPANVSWLEFELRWQGNERLHLMIHGPMKADHSMPSYMAMGGSPGRACIAIPTAEILPGMWEVMAHAGSPGYQDTPFKILINGEGAKDAKLRAGPHGHPVREDWSMDMKQAVGCR